MVALSKSMTIKPEDTMSTYMERNHTYHVTDVTKGWMNKITSVACKTHICNIR